MEQSVRVVVVADVCLYRTGLAHNLERRSGFDVVGTAANGPDALDIVARAAPDIVLLDMGLEGARTVIDGVARTTPTAKVVALAIRESPAEVVRVAEAGVAGYVPREASMDDLVEAMAAVLRGELVCSPRVSAELFEHISELSAREHEAHATPLTRREQDVARLIEKGMTNKEISRALNIRVATVKHHVHNVLGKLRVHGRASAAAFVRRNARTVLRDRAAGRVTRDTS